MRQLLADDLEHGFLEKPMRLVGFSEEDAVFKTDDGRILAVTLCVCGEHLAYIEAEEHEIEKTDLGDA